MALTYPQYQNGRFPLSMLVHLEGSGGANHYLPPATAARWYALQRRAAAWRKARGLPPLPLTIWPGWDAYRPIAAQEAAKTNACAQGNCLAAATVGESSHGLRFRQQDAAALDAGNWSDVYQGDYEAFFADARAVGFVADFIRPGVNGYPKGTPREFWHLFDFNCWGPIPAFSGATPFPDIQEEDDMRLIDAKDRGFALIGAGYFRSLNAAEGAALTGKMGIASKTVTPAEFDTIRSACIGGDDNFRPPVRVPNQVTDFWSHHPNGNPRDAHAAGMLTQIRDTVLGIQANGTAVTVDYKKLIDGVVAGLADRDLDAETIKAAVREAFDGATIHTAGA
jgi:hypothetical protein